MYTTNTKKTLLLLCALTTVTIQSAQPTNPWYASLTGALLNVTKNIKTEHLIAGAAAIGTTSAGLYYYFKYYKPSRTINDNISLIPFAIATTKSDKVSKKYIEDYFAIASLNKRFTILSVFDGHGGSFVARTLANGSGKNAIKPMAVFDQNPHEESPDIAMPSLNHIILQKLINTANIDLLLSNHDHTTQLFTEAFQDADALLTSEAMALNPSGSTASVVLIDKQKHVAHIAHAGDSRVVIYRNSCIEAITKDHDYCNQREIDRLLDTPFSEKFTEKDLRSLFDETVEKQKAANLEVSRAIGDGTKKAQVPSLCATPEVRSVELENDDMIIVASDGVWKVVDDKASKITSVTKTLRNLEAQYHSSQIFEDEVHLKTDSAFQMGNSPLANYFASQLNGMGIASHDDVTALVTVYQK